MRKLLFILVLIISTVLFGQIALDTPEKGASTLDIVSITINFEFSTAQVTYALKDDTGAIIYRWSEVVSDWVERNVEHKPGKEHPEEVVTEHNDFSELVSSFTVTPSKSVKKNLKNAFLKHANKKHKGTVSD